MAEPPASAGNRRLLLVDNDPSFTQVLEQDFRARGFEVEIAGTSDEALRKAAAAPPDLVVLDLHLADDGALRLLRVWKAEAPTLPVLLVSASASLRVVVDALKEGARGFLAKPVGAAALVAELEERPRAEGVERFFAIAPGLLAIAGFDGNFRMLNPAWEKALGYSIAELCAKPYRDLVHPDNRDNNADETLETRNGQAVFRFANRYRCKDGSYRWLAWSATLSAADGLIYGSATDVTKSVRMVEALHESNQRLEEMLASREVQLRESTVKNDSLVELGRFKDEVAAMIVHDLKNPLSVIVSNYDYILDGFDGSGDCLEALRDSQIAGRRMLRLLTNLVDVAQLEEGTLDVSTSKVTLSQLLRPIAEQRRVLARSRKIAIVFVPSPEITVTVDADLVTRTFENIFDNALRQTPSGGTIEIELREIGPNIEIRIGNSGCAIPIEARSTIFDKYRQTTSDVGRMSLGLGLYFCRLAIEAQGGGIWIEETERLPTVFGIRLPRLAASPAR